MLLMWQQGLSAAVCLLVIISVRLQYESQYPGTKGKDYCESCLYFASVFYALSAILAMPTGLLILVSIFEAAF